MANPSIKFYKGSIAPATPEAGLIWFDSANKLIRVYTSDTAYESYSGIQALSYNNKQLTWTNADGTTQSVSFNDVASASALSALSGTVDNVSAAVSTNVSNISTLNTSVATVSNYIKNNVETALTSETVARTSADTSLKVLIDANSGHIATLSNAVQNLPTDDNVKATVTAAISALVADVTVAAGYGITGIHQENGVIQTVDSKPIMDSIAMSLAANNVLTVKNTDGTVSGTVDLSILAQDKFISAVSYNADDNDLVFTWTEKDGSTTSVTVPVDDLVDTYTAGTGISINGNEVALTSEFVSMITSAASATDYVRSVDSTTTTAKAVKFAVNDGKLTGEVQGVSTTDEMNEAIAASVTLAVEMAASDASAKATSAVQLANEYTDTQIAAALTWAVFA